MRAVILSALIICLLTTPVQALSLVNAEMISSAQTYGQTNYKQDTDTFLLPWTAFEEKAAKINEFTERAYLYTPYLLIALQAKDSVLSGSKPRLADTEQLLTDYNGFLTFELILYGDSTNFTNQLTVSVQQDKQNSLQAQLSIPSSPQKHRDSWGNQRYKLQCYLYLPDKGVQSAKPVRITVKAADKRERIFNFHLGRIQ